MENKKQTAAPSTNPVRPGRAIKFAQFREQVQFIGSQLGLRGAVNLENKDDAKKVVRMELHPAGVYYMLADGEDGAIPSSNVVNVRFARESVEAGA